ncbi:unnamed protein product [Arctogadus glacialis]
MQGLSGRKKLRPSPARFSHAAEYKKQSLKIHMADVENQGGKNNEMKTLASANPKRAIFNSQPAQNSPEAPRPRHCSTNCQHLPPFSSTCQHQANIPAPPPSSTQPTSLLHLPRSNQHHYSSTYQNQANLQGPQSQ